MHVLNAHLAAIRAACWTALVALAMLPVDVAARSPSLCVWRAVFGFECPGCGATRAACAFLHGDIGRAWAFNRAATIVMPLMLILVAADGARLLRRRAARAAGNDSR